MSRLYEPCFATRTDVGGTGINYLRTTRPRVKHVFDSLTGVTAGSADITTALADAPTAHPGVQSTGLVRLRHAASVGHDSCDITLDGTIQFGETSEIVLWCYVDGPPTPSGAGASTDFPALLNFKLMEATDSSGWADQYQRRVSKGWNKIVLGRAAPAGASAEFAAYGGGTATFSCTTIRILMYEANYQVDLYLAQIEINARTRPMVVNIFDDCRASAYATAKPIMDDLGLVGSLGVVGAILRDGGGSTLPNITENVMTRAQVQEVFADGWDCINHSLEHENMAAYTAAQAESEFAGCRDLIRSYGVARDGSENMLVLVGGTGTSAIYAGAQAAGMQVAWNLGIDGDVNIDSHHPVQRYGIRRYDNGAEFAPGILVTDNAGPLRFIDLCIAKGAPAFLMWHGFDATATSGVINSTAWFTAVMQYIARLRDGGVIDVVNASTWRKRLDAAHQMPGLVA